ncbi:hypothetical protein FEF09_09020 [Chitinophaga pinensis]|uniref:7-cyano-7-deazaguanine synthase n=2 Tax=Chitinophaga pinensis TaxID=79329 RepID=A0A5C6LW54_9BACT|nr:hypothetical protein FEF09_09020 [Chitinophaga pinensis]
MGSHSTRTTHPHYMEMMRQLSRNIGLGVQIENPYQFKTKGEMLRECGNIPLVQSTNTMSCSHPSGRFAGQGNGHCGYCVPCIIRQSAYLAANVQDRSIYRVPVIGQTVAIDRAEGADILAFKYMIEKTSQNPSYLTTVIRSTGPLGTNIDPYIDIIQGVYVRWTRWLVKFNYDDSIS